MRPLLAVVFVLALLAGGIVGWTLRGALVDAPIARVVEPAPTPAAVPAPRPEVARTPLADPSPRVEKDAASDARRPATQPTVAELLVQLDRALSAEPCPVGTDAEIEARYRDASVASLQAARALLQRRADEATRRIVEQRKRDKLYVETIVAPGEKALQSKPTRPGATVTTYFEQEPLDDGNMRVRTIDVPLGQYPELASVQHELDWLRRKLRPR